MDNLMQMNTDIFGDTPVDTDTDAGYAYFQTVCVCFKFGRQISGMQ